MVRRGRNAGGIEAVFYIEGILVEINVKRIFPGIRDSAAAKKKQQADGGKRMP
jgi:hypothetical protein